MRELVFTLIAMFTYSCVGTNLYKKVNYGRYNANSEFYTGNIIIKADSTFEYTLIVPHNSSTCKGSWEVISRKILLVNGKDATTYKGADSLFFKRLDCKNDTIKFVSKNKIVFRNYIFKKISK